MNNNMKIIPELRFPEFENDEEWDDIPLNDLCTLITKGTTPTTVGYSYTDSGVNFIKIESILEGEINLEKAAFISLECNEALKRSQLKENDILISIAGALGVVTTVRNKILPANTNQALSIVRLDNELQRDYVKSFLKSNQISSEISKIKAGAAQPNISLSQVSNFRILIPLNPQEQQKIASCLSSLDELIAAHSQKLDLLKDHKKGLMQNLFPNPSSGSGGESVPKYRFPEFENDGDWVEKKLSQVADYENGKAHEKDIDGDGKYIVVNSKFISTESEIVKYSGTAHCLATKGDVLMVLSDLPNGRAIAKCFYVNDDDKYSVNQRICKITAFDSDTLFLFYIIDRNSYFLAFDDGVKQTNLKKDDVLDFPFLIPKNSKEQQKIASCLSAVDELITAQAERIAQLQQHKKGLMQGLFPKMEG
jgi:type I restriction enzyme S subunit